MSYDSQGGSDSGAGDSAGTSSPVEQQNESSSIMWGVDSPGSSFGMTVDSGNEDSTESVEQDEVETAPEDAEEKEAVEPEKEEDKEKLLKAVKPNGKSLKVQMSDGSSVELSPEAAVPVVVDGKKESVTLKDLMSNYSGKTNWDRRYNELSKKEKEFTSRVSAQDQFLKDFSSRAVTHPMSAIDLLVERAGLDRTEFVSKFREQLVNQVKSYLEMTPEQRAIAEARETAEYHKSKAASLQKQRELDQAEQSQRQLVTQMQEKYGISADQYEQYREELLAANVTENEKDLTPELIAYYHQNATAWATVGKVFDKVDPSLRETYDSKSEFAKTVFELISQKGYSEKDAIEIVKEAVGASRAEKVNQKAKKNGTAPKTAPNKVQSKQQPQKQTSPNNQHKINDLIFF